MDRNALTSRIDRLESLLLSAMNNTTHLSSHIPTDSDSQFPNISVGKHNDGPRSAIAQAAQENREETDDMNLLGKEFGIMRIEPSPTHGGQHWVSSMFQV